MHLGNTDCLINSIKIDIVAVRMDLELNVTACSAFLFITSSETCGKQPVGYFGSTVDVGKKMKHIICGAGPVNTLHSSDLSRLQALPHVGSMTYNVIDIRNCVLLYFEMSHWCLSELVMI